MDSFKCSKKSSIVQFMRHGPTARDGIPFLHSDGETLPEVACLSCVTSNDRDTPAELGDKKFLKFHFTNCDFFMSNVCFDE